MWRAIACRLPHGKRRETFLSVFGPLSLLLLFTLWATSLVLAFGLLQWSLTTPLNSSQQGPAGMQSYLYLSGVTFFTLGYGDVARLRPWADSSPSSKRALASALSP